MSQAYKAVTIQLEPISIVFLLYWLKNDEHFFWQFCSVIIIPVDGFVDTEVVPDKVTVEVTEEAEEKKDSSSVRADF